VSDAPQKRAQKRVLVWGISGSVSRSCVTRLRAKVVPERPFAPCKVQKLGQAARTYS
jgi:hypothetical protein